MDPKISGVSDQALSTESVQETQSAENEIQGSTAPAEGKAIPLVRSAGGPRTPTGKERSKINSLKHGFFSKAVLLKDEPREELDYLLTELHNDRQPVGMLEVVLVDKLAAVIWRLCRVLRAEGQEFENAKEYLGLSGIEPGGIHMELLLRYGASLDRELDRTLKQLERLQRIRLGQPVPPSIDLNVEVQE